MTESRSETLDLPAAEIRRIERDLHDGAQMRMATVGMAMGLAGKLVRSNPGAAEALLDEARQTTLDDLRSVVRGIHPPVPADRYIAGTIEALALPGGHERGRTRHLLSVRPRLPWGLPLGTGRQCRSASFGP